jgi:hypothetical protein
MVLDVGARLGVTLHRVATGMDSKPPATLYEGAAHAERGSRPTAPPPIRTMSSQLGRLSGWHACGSHACGELWTARPTTVLAQRQDVVRAAGVPSHRRAHDVR